MSGVEEWSGYGLRVRPPLSGRVRPPELSPLMSGMVEGGLAAAAAPFVGITEAAAVRPGLFGRRAVGASTKAITEAARTFVASLSTEQRARLIFPLDAAERRLWLNVHPNILRHGLMLEDLSVAQRDAALALLTTSLSERGARQARDVMRLNGLLIDLTGSAEEYGEWPYWVSLYGEPSDDEPWGWQIDGHHLAVNCLVAGDQLWFTPTFMGSEPCHVREGRLAGTEILVPEERAGLDLIRSFDDGQLAAAVLYDSIEPNALPQELQHIIDGRMIAGAFKDNAVIAPAGARGDGMSDAQRRLLRNVIATFVGWGNDGHAAVYMDEVDAHLDETSFCWMGARSDAGPFYYRVQSPVVLIEFDHHPGIFFDNLVPSRVHIHSILRAPNGGDYGASLLADHYQRFDHGHGDHR